MSRRYRPGAAQPLMALACTVCLAIVVAACGSSSSGGSKSSSSGGTSSSSSGSASKSASSSTPFTYLMVLDQTGPSKAFAPANVFGAEQAANYLNQTQGGILGHKIKIVILNDDGDPATTTSDIEQYLSSHPKPQLVYPGGASDEIAAAVPLLTRAGVYSIGNSEGVSGTLSSNASTTHPEQFTIFTSTSVPPEQAAAWFKSKGIKKVGLLTGDEAYDTADAAEMKTSLAKLGISYVQATFPLTSVSLTPEVQSLKAGGATAIYCGCLGPTVGYAMKARADLGWKVPMLASLAASALDITTLVPKADLSDVYELMDRTDSSAIGEKLPATKYLLAHGWAQHGGIAELSIAANGWDPLFIAANAAKQANSIDSSALAKATETLSPTAQKDPNYLDFPQYSFTANSHVVQGGSSDFVIVPAGKVINGMVKSGTL